MIDFASTEDRHFAGFAESDPDEDQEERAIWLELASRFAESRRAATERAHEKFLAAHAELETSIAELHASLALVEDAARLVSRDP